jgi:O-antigen ligase
LIVLVIINLLTSRIALWRTAWVLVLVGALLGTISMYQVLTSSYGFEFGGFGRIKFAHIVGSLHEPRIAGPVGDPNFYAQVLVMLVPIALYRLWGEASIRLKVAAAYALAATILALVFTYSRGGALALGVVLVLGVIQQKKLNHLLLGLLVLAPLIFFIPEQFEGRLSTLDQLIPGRSEATLHSDSSFRQRTLLMRSAWGMFADHPFLGVGAGNYSEHYEEYAAQVGSTVSSYENFGMPRLPHSLYLQVAAETGVVGLVVFMAIIIATLLKFRSAHRLFKAAGDLRSSSIVFSLALGFIGYLTTSLFLHGDYMRYFWLLVALAMAAKHIAQNNHRVAAERGEPETCPRLKGSASAW